MPLPDELSFQTGAAIAFGTGTSLLINPDETEDVVGAIQEATHGLGARLSMDASLGVSNDTMRRQVTIRGSWTFFTVGQAACAQYIADRNRDVDRLFAHSWRLDQAEAA